MRKQVAKVREAIDAAAYYQGGEWTITGVVMKRKCIKGAE